MDVSFTFSPSTVMLAEVSRAAMSMAGKESFWSFVTNSCFVALLVTGIIIWFANKATSKMTLIPHPWQNFFESIIEAIYSQVEAIVGPKQAPRAFPLLATLFIFILVANYFGLLPGVGTIGWGESSGGIVLSHVAMPLLRPATADLNMTLGIALCFMIIWFYLTIRELGFWGFIVHTFGAKGGTKGFMGVFIAGVFLLVGAIEIVSILFRPGSLSLRLYGNIYAGETLLHTMMTLGEMFKLGPVGQFIIATLAPIPFYFMELLVGLLQATVFTLLCAVYIQLSTTHDEHHGEEGSHDHH